MSSTFCAQEIEENKINESKEALSRQKSLEAYENAVKGELNKQPTNPIFSVNDSSSVFLPRNAFSYTKNCNITNKPKPLLFPKPRNRQHANTNERGNLAGNIQHSGVKIDSKPINIDTPTQISNDSPTISNPNDSSKNKIHSLEDYIKLEVTETGPPPLPSRPPPVFKYPPGTFCKEQDLNEATKEHQIRSSQNKFCQSDQLDINGGKIAENQGSKPLPELGVEAKHCTRKSFSEETNSLGIQKKIISALVETEETMKPTPTAEPETNTRKSIPNVVFKKRPINIPLVSHENKPPQPLPRPELYGKKEKTSVPLDMNKSEKLSPALDLELKTDFIPKPKAQAMNVPCKTNNLFHQRLEQILIEQRIREQECLNPVNSLKQLLDGRLADEVHVSQSTIHENISSARKMSIENKSETDESFIPKPEKSFKSKVENIGIDPSSAELRDELDKMDLNQDIVADFSSFHSLNRPTLPQKIKSTQRSLSYTSLVQTVKDISTTIWNPSDKSKRNSTGMTTKVTDQVMIRKNEAENFASDGKFLEKQQSFEEEKDAILRSSWFHDVSATEAQHRLLKLDQDGAFLIRPTSRPTDIVQYTAMITYAGRVFNIHIRRKANYYFALGKEKEGEKSFQRLSDLIKYYQDVPFDIHPSGSSNAQAICFRVTPPHSNV